MMPSATQVLKVTMGMGTMSHFMFLEAVIVYRYGIGSDSDDDDDDDDDVLSFTI